MKKCYKCKKTRQYSCFSKNKNRNDGLTIWCKKCVRKYDFNRKRKYPCKLILKNIKARCNNPKDKAYKYYGGKGIRCLITLEELRNLWFAGKAYEMKKPSIDRKNHNLSYMFTNCQFIEFSKNIAERNRRMTKKGI